MWKRKSNRHVKEQTHRPLDWLGQKILQVVTDFLLNERAYVNIEHIIIMFLTTGKNKKILWWRCQNYTEEKNGLHKLTSTFQSEWLCGDI